VPPRARTLDLPVAMAVVRDARAGLHAIGRGATILQLRDPELTVRRLEEEARRLVQATSVPLLVSGRVDVVMATGAAGVNLPERDLPVAEARRLLPNRLLGRSVHSLDGAVDAERLGADYVLFGPVFPTASHPCHAGTGLEALREVASTLSVPVVAIGGIDASRIDACREAGAAGFAAIRYFSGERTR
jgi:thiamine-phosphate pyrophosphorylase